MVTENKNGMAGQPQQRQQAGRPSAARMNVSGGRPQATGVASAANAAGARPTVGGAQSGGSSAGGANAGGTGRGTAPSGNSNGGKRTTIIVVIGVIVAALAVWLLVWLFACNGNSLIDSSAQDGQAPYKSDAEIQAELDRQVEEGMFNISIASVIQFDDGTSDGVAYIENVPGNRYNMQVTITEDETGETLYESGILKPNQFIEKIALTKDLDAGSYAGTATFTALDENTYDEVGKAAAKVTINVLA